MNKKGYTFIQNEDFLFSFVSQGNQGEILKVVVFQFFKNNKYNVALLDLIPETNEYSDEVNSNNGDITKVLTTVLQIIILFLEKILKRQCIWKEIQEKNNYFIIE